MNDLGEFELIEYLTKRLPPLDESGIGLGVGDDAAQLLHGSEHVSVSVDTMVDGVHFRIERIRPSDLGWKLYATTMSDIAAMGAQPRALFVSVTIPEYVSLAVLEGVYDGLGEAATQFGAGVLGGDVTSGPCFMLSATAVGSAAAAGIRRSGAVPGEDVWVSGEIGWSYLGLQIQESGLEVPKAIAARAAQAHYRPEPRFKLASTLANEQIASALIDVSDGLLQDAGHVAQGSRCTLKLQLEEVPIAETVDEPSCQAEQYLTGGEDYELLFTAPERARPRLTNLSGSLEIDGLRLTRIGKVLPMSEDAGVLLQEGEKLEPLADWLKARGVSEGFTHFKPRS